QLRARVTQVQVTSASEAKRPYGSEATSKRASASEHTSDRRVPHPLRPVPFRHRIPIHDVPPRRNVVRALVLIFQIIRVLPDVESKDGRLAFHERIVLVRRARDRELAAVVDQPRPSGTEPARSRGG